MFFNFAYATSTFLGSVDYYYFNLKINNLFQDGVRSITFSEKDNSCQCNVDFDGISMRKSAADDFSVSTSTRFCFASERWIVYLNGSKPKYQTFETNKAYYVKVKHNITKILLRQ